jgi:cyclophilin family peptidyl-prolyl cis-trans isomerase
MRGTTFLILALCQAIQISDAFQQLNRWITTPLAPSLKMMTDRHRYGDEDSDSSHRLYKSESTQSLSSDKQRRTLIKQFVQSIVVAPILGYSRISSADDSSPLPQVTHKVFMDIRISRADGTFYVRDTIEDPTDEPFYAHLVLGLFGNNAPNSVQQFLQYVDVPFDLDNPNPSYATTRFRTLDSESGLLIGGISGLDLTTLAGGNVLEYKGRVIPAKLWLENADTSKAALAHDKKGLLTHRNLDLTPSFGITTRSSATSLDSSHTVFGCVLEDTDGFLDKVVDLPAITSDGIVSRTSNEPVNVGGGNAVASSVFTAQRKIFRDAAKTFGDSRLEKVYDGKLLRRIEVTQMGLL